MRPLAAILKVAGLIAIAWGLMIAIYAPRLTGAEFALYGAGFALFAAGVVVERSSKRADTAGRAPRDPEAPSAEKGGEAG